ncbi:hypothetical protein B0H17DRAFT_1152977 [Mycena rosella]|uniref:Uncharacterized protein n=1 Tax=Mycena rosella TaxID=1033263 RepID=A0AAD7B9H9_MYCRO|nr:hypothetical protein B0H17DRAFT_1152977 [Mycena rosella]
MSVQLLDLERDLKGCITFRESGLTSIHRFSGSSKKAALISSKWPGKVSLKPKDPTRVTMGSRAAQDKQRSKAATEHQIRMENLEPQEQEVLDALADFEQDYGDDEEIIQVNDVLDGTSRAEMSHGGGEFEDAIWQDWSLNDKGSKRTQAFAVQMEDIVSMYTVWMGLGTPAPLRLGNGEEGGYPIHVVNLFGEPFFLSFGMFN